MRPGTVDEYPTPGREGLMEMAKAVHAQQKRGLSPKKGLMVEEAREDSMAEDG